jgi:hypothetical protein
MHIQRLVSFFQELSGTCAGVQLRILRPVETQPYYQGVHEAAVHATIKFSNQQNGSKHKHVSLCASGLVTKWKHM